jgi:hypothetical protein
LVNSAITGDNRKILETTRVAFNTTWDNPCRKLVAVSVAPLTTFSLGDPAVATELLSTAGFESIDFADIREPVFYGPHVDTAIDALTRLNLVKDALAKTDEAPDRVLQRLRTLLEAHMTAEGVLFDSRAWIISARRA